MFVKGVLGKRCVYKEYRKSVRKGVPNDVRTGVRSTISKGIRTLHENYMDKFIDICIYRLVVMWQHLFVRVVELSVSAIKCEFWRQVM